MQALKCVVIGVQGAGKTSMVVENNSLNVIRNGKPVNVSLWDAGSGGREDYDRLLPLSYPETDIFMIVFAVDNYQSWQLERVRNKWVPEVRHHWPAGLVFLVGCKIDLRDDLETVEKLREKGASPITRHQGEELAKEVGADGYLECSAKTQEGLSNVFNTAIDTALKYPRNGDKPNAELKKRKPNGRCATM